MTRVFTRFFTRVFTSVLLSFFSLVLLSEGASAHHVYGIEVSPTFEVIHALAEPLLFALGGACLAAFLSQRASVKLGARLGRRLWAVLVFGCTALVFATALALASVIEEGAGLFLLWDLMAGVLFFQLAKYYKLGLKLRSRL